MRGKCVKDRYGGDGGGEGEEGEGGGGGKGKGGGKGQGGGEGEGGGGGPQSSALKGQCDCSKERDPLGEIADGFPFGDGADFGQKPKKKKKEDFRSFGGDDALAWFKVENPNCPADEVEQWKAKGGKGQTPEVRLTSIPPSIPPILIYTYIYPLYIYIHHIHHIYTLTRL